MDGWVFHGTSAARAERILSEGMRTTFAIANDRGAGQWRECAATHWGTPAVAAFYAEDLIESLEDPHLELALIAARLDDLRSLGPMAADGQTLDCPLLSRLERPEHEILSAWDASDMGWEACRELYGTFVLLSPVPGGLMQRLGSPGDVEELADAYVAAPGIAP